MLCGLPGSGKSYLAQRLTIWDKKPEIISSDSIRKELYGDENILGNFEEIFTECRTRIKNSLKAGKNVVYDATNLRKEYRKEFLQDIKASGYQTACIFFRTSLEDCIRRNKQRTRKVPEEKIRKMWDNFDPPRYSDGFDYIYTYTPEQYDK